MAADIQVDPEVARASAARLAALADELAAAAARVRDSAVGPGAAGLGAAGFGVAGRRDALAAELGRDAVELALVADGVRRDGAAVGRHDQAVAGWAVALDPSGSEGGSG